VEMNRLTVVLLLGILCAAYAVDVDVEEAEHDADTPIRQAQRAMLAEREEATAAHAEEDVLGMRLAEVSAETEAPQPHARRISGAAKSFTPNDRMCVMCQFLTQRIQQEIGGAYGSVGPAGGVSYQFLSGVGSTSHFNSFMEMMGGDEDSESDEDLIEIVDEDEADADDEDEAEAEDEEEADEESEEESEDESEAEAEDEEESTADEEIDSLLDAAESEDAELEAESEEDAFLELSSDEGESESDEWTTPEYSADAAPAPTPIALAETDATSQTPTFADAEEEEEQTEESSEESTEAVEGTADEVEPAFFESSAVAAQESDSEWVTAEYVAEAAAPKAEMVEAEMTAFLQTDSDDSEEGEWTTPEFSDSQSASAGAKSYARVIVPAASEQSLIEATAAETVTSNEAALASAEVKLFAPRIIRSRRAGRGRPIIFHTAKRYRSADAHFPRPLWNRHDPHSPRHMSNRVLAGMALRNAESAAYDHLEQYCSTRLPESFGKFCRPVLRQFRRIVEGLSYGDHVNRVCMSVHLCKKNAYVNYSPHVRLSERN